MILRCLSVFLLPAVAMASRQCGYASCPQPAPAGVITAHLVAHTHDDVGWLKNVDEYYYGPFFGVQYILDSVIPELYKDPAKKYV